MNTQRPTRLAADASVNEVEVARLLSQRFGDGLVYLAEETDREVLRHAMASGLISSDGHVTARGHRLLARAAR